MADRKITDLTEMAAGTQGSNDLLTIVDVSEGAAADKNKKITFDSLFKGIPGDVGIGQPSPDQKLHVRSTSDDVIKLESLSGGNGPNLTFAHTGASPADNDTIGKLTFLATNDNSQQTTFADIKAISTDVSDGSEDAAFTFSTRNNGAFNERMRIDSAGNVGINTTSPGTSKLYVLGDTTNYGVKTEAPSGYGSLTLQQTSGNSMSLGMTSNNLFVYDNNAGATRVTLDSSGQVGIGTTSPSATLHVAGPVKIDNANATNELTFAGTDFTNVLSASTSGFQLGTTGAGYLAFLTNNSERMRIDSSGRLLRGTTSTSANANTVLQGSSGGTTGAARLFLQRGSAPANGQSMANIFFADNSSNEGAKISAVRDGGTWTSGSSHPTRLEFATTGNSASSPTERMRISNGGIVLVGKTTSHNNNIAGIGYQNLVQIQGASTGSGLEVSNTNGVARLNLNRRYTPANGNELSHISFGADANTSIERARISCTAEFTNANKRGGRLTFLTSSNGGYIPTEHFRISNNGTLTATDTTIGSNSDSRLKTNVADFSYDLEDFKLYQPKTFDWKNPELHGNKAGQRGFIAQDVEAIDAYWVDQLDVDEESADAQFLDADRLAKTLKLGKKDAMYISVIQQLLAKIETLEAKVAALEAG